MSTPRIATAASINGYKSDILFSARLSHFVTFQGSPGEKTRGHIADKEDRSIDVAATTAKEKRSDAKNKPIVLSSVSRTEY
jgi:hypothetical protein